jgi:hypothetical protein
MQFDIDLTGTLVVLDARPDGIIYRDLIPEHVNFARIIYEGLSFIFFSCISQLAKFKRHCFLLLKQVLVGLLTQISPWQMT